MNGAAIGISIEKISFKGVWSNCNTNCKSYTILQIATVIKDQTRFLWFCHFTNKSKHSDKWDSGHECIEASFMTLATKCSIITITCWNIDRNISKGKWLIMTSFVYISQAISLQEMSFQGIVTHHQKRIWILIGIVNHPGTRERTCMCYLPKMCGKTANVADLNSSSVGGRAGRKNCFIVRRRSSSPAWNTIGVLHFEILSKIFKNPRFSSTFVISSSICLILKYNQKTDFILSILPEWLAI